MPSTLRQERDRVRTERRRQDVLDASARVFVRQGYHRTLISDIAAEAGVGQGTFYRHFPDKRAAFEAVFDRFTELLFAEFAGMSANLPKDAREYRDSSVSALLRMAEALERNQDLAKMLMREAPAVDRGLEEKVASFQDGFVFLAKTFLDHATSEGFARPCDTTLVAQAIVGMGISMAHQWWTGRAPDVTLEHLINEVVDFAFFGITDH
jgi:AcrR family transcriptional regulator